MSRHVVGEYLLEGTLEARSPVAIGSGEPGAGVDSTCVRDGNDRLIVPGTALAGLLRQRFGDDAAPFGSQAVASHLFIDDAVCDDATPVVEFRDGVGIDRRTGAAADTVLYAHEVVARGSTFTLRIRLEAVASPTAVHGESPVSGVGLSKDEAKAWIVAIAGHLATPQSVGRGTSTGLGSVELTNASLRWIGMADRGSLLAFLKDGYQNPAKAQLDLAEAREATLGALGGTGGPRIRVVIPWRAKSPLLVSVGANGLADRVPQTSVRDGRAGVAGVAARKATTSLVIPGRSWKGVLRTRAERIVRTLIEQDAPEDFLAQMSQDLGPVQRLFGRTPLRANGQAKAQPGQAGALRVHEVYSPEVKGWRELMTKLAAFGEHDDSLDRSRAKGAQTAAVNALLKGKPLILSQNVAISRWTGGAEDGKLFATVAAGPWFGRGDKPGEATWDPLVLELDVSRLGATDDERRSALMLLVFVLRDLAEGWIGIGFGTTRGFGEIEATLGDITISNADQAAPGLPASFSVTQVFASPDWAAPMVAAWNAECEAVRHRADSANESAQGGDR